jgi:hypothetical protein
MQFSNIVKDVSNKIELIERSHLTEVDRIQNIQTNAENSNNTVENILNQIIPTCGSPQNHDFDV